MYISQYVCDSCGTTVAARNEDDTPIGWWLLSLYNSASGWSVDDEYHLCSDKCVRLLMKGRKKNDRH